MSGSSGAGAPGRTARLPVSPLFQDPFRAVAQGSERGSAPAGRRSEVARTRPISMAFYEHIFLVRQDASNTQVEALTQQFKTVIEERGGKVTKSEYWGVKPLTYRMKKNRKAHYTLMNVEAPSAALDEVERQESINEDVLRYLTVRVDELEEGPSAMMRSRGRDDREGEGGGRFGDRGGRFGDREGGRRDFGDRPRDFGDRGPRPPRPPREPAGSTGGEGRS